MSKLLRLVTRLDDFVDESADSNGNGNDAREHPRREPDPALRDRGPRPGEREPRPRLSTDRLNEAERDDSAPQAPEDPEQSASDRAAARSRAERAREGRSRLLESRQAAPAGVTAAASPAEAESAPRRLYARALTSVEALFDAARRRRDAPEELVGAAARLIVVADELVEEVSDSEALVAHAMAPYPSAPSYVAPHSVNVAVLGIRVAVGAGLSDDRIRTVCRAGLAHQVGAVHGGGDLSRAAVDAGPPPAEELELRPGWSREILEDAGEPLAEAAPVVHQVHERLDGSGHPRGLSGEDILIEARVLGAVDFLDGVVHPRPHDRDGVSGSGSLGVQELVKMSRAFGDDVLKGVVRGIGLFPAGTLVRLSSGEVALVKENRPDNPMRPLVEVLEIAGGPGGGQPRTVDLAHTPHVYVAGALSTADLEELTHQEDRTGESSQDEPASGNR